MKPKAYIYPVSKRLKSGDYNPYLQNFIQATKNKILFLNEERPSSIGFLDFFRYILQTDFLILNWIENLPEKKGGGLQSVLFLLVLRFKKFLGLRVLWIMHNKVSHSTSHFFLKRLLFKNLLKRTDLILTHAKEGVKFAESLHPGASSRIIYFPHPVVSKKHVDIKKNKKYDILIWGNLAPYKGIDAFLQFLKERNALNKFRILIIGKSSSEDFFLKIRKYSSNKIIIKNQFISSSQLVEIIAESDVVLFTHSGKSVLSSGALMDSIAHNAIVIGPDLGAFSELGDMGIIETYNDFEELIHILNNKENLNHPNKLQKINKFLNEYSWAEFGKFFESKL